MNIRTKANEQARSSNTLPSGDNKQDETEVAYQTASSNLITRALSLGEEKTNPNKNWETFADEVKGLAECIEKKKNDNNPRFNIAFYTNVLTAALTLLESPNNETRNKFRKLIKNDPLGGQPNNNLRGFGFVLMLMGVGLFATFVAELYRSEDNPSEPTYYGYYGLGSGVSSAFGLFGWLKGRAKGIFKQASTVDEAAQAVIPKQQNQNEHELVDLESRSGRQSPLLAHN